MKSSNALRSDTKQLVICRHAKSSWQDADLSDFQRPLNKRGERDAPEMGSRLRQRGIRPDMIITSPATRAMATAVHYATQLDFPLEKLQAIPSIYTASVPDLLALLRQVDPMVGTLLLVGHNPESTALANVLGQLLIDNIPTGGVVALAFSLQSWHELESGAGRLLFFDYPKSQEKILPH